MKVNKRLQEAAIELAKFVLDWQERHDLTVPEAVLLLLDHIHIGVKALYNVENDTPERESGK